MSNLAAALGAWRERLGSDRVCVDEDVRAVAETSTFATTQRIPAILHPASREEVQDCLRIANDFLVPLYPISCGKNWGSGSRVPVRDDCVLLDLGQMNRILDFDKNWPMSRLNPASALGSCSATCRSTGLT